MQRRMHSERADARLGVPTASGDASKSQILPRPTRRAPINRIDTTGGISGPPQGSRGENGAILILALVYIFTVGLIVAALADWATNDLNNTAHFTSARSLQYALSSVTNTAIQSMRYSPIPSTTPPTGVATPAAATPGYCWTPASGYTYDGITPVIDGANVAVWCSTVEDLSKGATRVVTFSACLSTTSNSACATSPLLQAVVSYDDYPPGGGPLLTVQCTPAVNCGEGMTLQSWTWLTQSS
jgi:hypothetical protein